MSITLLLKLNTNLRMLDLQLAKLKQVFPESLDSPGLELDQFLLADFTQLLKLAPCSFLSVHGLKTILIMNKIKLIIFT